jgi:hypothetical protein
MARKDMTRQGMERQCLGTGLGISMQGKERQAKVIHEKDNKI